MSEITYPILNGFCPSCEKEARIQRVIKDEIININGLNVMVKSDYFLCHDCDTEFIDASVNVDPLPEAYKKANIETAYTSGSSSLPWITINDKDKESTYPALQGYTNGQYKCPQCKELQILLDNEHIINKNLKTCNDQLETRAINVEKEYFLLQIRHQATISSNILLNIDNKELQSEIERLKMLAGQG